MNNHPPDTPVAVEPPRGQEITRYVIAVIFFTIGGAVLASSRMADLGPLGVVGLTVVAAVAALDVAIAVYLFRHRGGAR